MTQTQLPLADTLDFGVGSKALFNNRPVEICFVGNGKNRQITWRIPGEKDPIKQWVTIEQLQSYETSPLPANVFRVGDRVQSKQQVGMTDGVIFNVVSLNGDTLTLEGIGRDGKPIRTPHAKASDFELVSGDQWAAWEKVLQQPAAPAPFAVGDTVTLTEKFAKSAGLNSADHYRITAINQHGFLSLSSAGMEVPLIAPEKVQLVQLAQSDHQWQVGDHASIKPEIAARFELDPNMVYIVDLVSPHGFISLRGLSAPAAFSPNHLVVEKVVAVKDDPTPPAAPVRPKPQPRNNPNIPSDRQLFLGEIVKTRRGQVGIIYGDSNDRVVKVRYCDVVTRHYRETLELLPSEIDETNQLPDAEVERLKDEIATITTQRDKLLTDPVRLQVKELEVKLAAAEAAREAAEKRAIQHEAQMLAKVEAAQAEADKWRDELKALELGQPVTPPPAPTILKTEIKTLVQSIKSGERREASDKEFAEHLNAGWEILHINTMSVLVEGFDYPERHVTLKRLVQLPAFPPQPTARAAADLAEEFVQALDDEVDPADLDTELDPVVPISEFAITPEERDALDKLHAPAKQVIILPQQRPSALDRIAPNFAQTNPLGELIRQDGVDALHAAQNQQTLAAMRAAYTNALQRTRTYSPLLTAEVES